MQVCSWCDPWQCVYSSLPPARAPHVRLCLWWHWRYWSAMIQTPHPYQTGRLLKHVVRQASGCYRHMWAPCGHDWSCVISDWSEGPFFWHFKTANACFFSKVYTTMKFQLVCQKFLLVCTPILEHWDWFVQTHWSEGAHVWLPMHIMNVSTLKSSQYSAVRKKIILKINIKKRTPLTFITSPHTVISLYLDIMWATGGGGCPCGPWYLAYRFPLQWVKIFPKTVFCH